MHRRLARALLRSLAWLLVVSAAHLSPLSAFAQLMPWDPAPRPEDVLWQPMRVPTFSTLGPSDCTEHEGRVVMVGRFETFGRLRALGGLTWDGVSYAGIGTAKLPSFTSAVNVSGTLYAARGSSDVTPHNEVFRWNGSDWDTVATAQGAVTRLTAHAGGLVAIGTFTTIGGVAALHVAFFNGSTWQAMGAGLTETFGTDINCRVVSVGTNVYVNAVGSPIHRWDGATWTSTIANVLNGTVSDIATDGVNLYAAGGFTKAGTDSCPGVGRWDGSAWHRVAAGLFLPNTIAWWNGQLVANVTDGTSRVSVLSGTHWSGLGDNSMTTVSRLFAAGARLVARAEYRPPSGAMANARVYDGVGWTDLADTWGPDMLGTNFYTNSGAVADGLLYVCGGNRTSANGTAAIRTNNIAAWNGTAWSGLSVGLGGQPMDVSVWAGDLIASGDFSVAGGRKVGRWDGTAWLALANVFSGLSIFVYDTSPFRDSLFAAHDGPVVGLSGTTWSIVGAGAGTNGSSYALLDWNDQLIATGSFTTADGSPASRVAAWTGTQWQALGSGLDGTGLALLAFEGDLIVGGSFTTAGGQSASGVARWDGSAWHAMGTTARSILDFAEIAGVLYAVGLFELPDATVLNTVARWTGSDWQLLGSGVKYAFSNPTNQLNVLPLDWIEAYQGDLYCGGSAAYAFGQVTACILRLPAANTVDVGNERDFAVISMSATPNPTARSTTLTFTMPSPGRARLAIYDAAGREVACLVDGPVLAGRHEVRWDAPSRPGVYFAKFDAPDGVRRVARIVRLN